MKITEFYSSGIKENGKFDIFFKCENNKEYRLINCEIESNNDNDFSAHDCNLKFIYNNYELD